MSGVEWRARYKLRCAYEDYLRRYSRAWAEGGWVWAQAADDAYHATSDWVFVLSGQHRPHASVPWHPQRVSLADSSPVDSEPAK